MAEMHSRIPFLSIINSIAKKYFIGKESIFYCILHYSQTFWVIVFLCQDVFTSHGIPSCSLCHTFIPFISHSFLNVSTLFTVTTFLRKCISIVLSFGKILFVTSDYVLEGHNLVAFSGSVRRKLLLLLLYIECFIKRQLKQIEWELNPVYPLYFHFHSEMGYDVLPQLVPCKWDFSHWLIISSKKNSNILFS